VRSVRIAVLGYGTVGRTFVELLEDERERLRRVYELDMALVHVRRSRDEAITPHGRDWEWTTSKDLGDSFAASQPDLVVQAIPSSSRLAGVATEQMHTAFSRHAHVVTATKSALTTDWAALDAAARDATSAIRVSAAAGAGLPAVDLARRGLRGSSCVEIRASLNGTSNFVLEALGAGTPLDDALAEARRLGIAEPDAMADLSGADAAAKITILANLMWRRARRADEVAVEAIDHATSERAVRAAREGRALRVIARSDEGRTRNEVVLETVDSRDPFFALRGAEKAVTFDCGPMGGITVSGGKSSPRAAASALLKDVVNVMTGDDAPGF
jgi:homoserine dehydrogenase